MKLAGVLTRSEGYPLDDPPAMVWFAIVHAVGVARQHGIEPVGSFEMAMGDTWDGSDQALRWEFVPTRDDTPPAQGPAGQWIDEAKWAAAVDADFSAVVAAYRMPTHEGDGQERMEG